MFRTLLFWEISRRLDDGRPLGSFLAWVVEHDPKTKAFHREFLELAPRLRTDADVLLERSAEKTRRTPLRLVSRSVVSSSSRSSVRWKPMLTVTLLAVFLTSLGLGGIGWISGIGSGKVFAAPTKQASGSPTAAFQSDAEIYDELVQLCRVSPNEIGPFFTSSNR